jgi:hypothetical protein
MFNINQNQLNDWIIRALNENKLVKLKDTEKYTLVGG